MSYKVIGVDPGSINVGWCIAEVTDKLNYITSGWINTAEIDKKMKPPERFNYIYNTLDAIIAEHQPERIVFEYATQLHDIFRCEGLMLALAGKHKLNVAKYNEASIKKYVAGKGNADKDEVLQSVLTYFGDDTIEFVSDHAADAAAFIIHDYRVGTSETIVVKKKKTTKKKLAVSAK